MKCKIMVINSSGIPEVRDFDPAEPFTGIVTIETLVANPEQPRKEFEPNALAQLGLSLRSGQENPVTAIPFDENLFEGMMIKQLLINDGERRIRASRQEGIKTVWISYRPGVTRKNLHTASFKSNCCRVSINHAETATAIDRERHSGYEFHEIAAMVGKTVQWAVSEHSLLKLHPTLLALVDASDKAKRLPMKIALALAATPSHDEQLKLWGQFKSQTASAAYHAIAAVRTRKSKNNGGKDEQGPRTRKPSDNMRIVRRKAGVMLRDLNMLDDLPQEVFDSFHGADVSGLLECLKDLAKNALKLRRHILKASKGERRVEEPTSSANTN